MTKEVFQIPFQVSLLKDPIANEIDIEFWARADRLIFSNPHVLVSDEILNFYFLVFYDAEVKNGGHSQLTYNADVMGVRSSDLIERFIEGAKMVGAVEYIGVAQDFDMWLRANPNEAASQTGFSGGRAEYLDDLDERFYELDDDQQYKLVELLDSSKSQLESNYLRDCIARKGEWRGDLRALEMVWLLRSDAILPVPDDEFQEVWSALFTEGQN